MSANVDLNYDPQAIVKEKQRRRSAGECARSADPSDPVSLANAVVADQATSFQRGLFGQTSVPGIEEAVVNPSRWSRVFVGAWRKTAPIHLLECLVALAGFVDCLNDDVTSHGKDVISIGDNLAEVCCTSGGRARDAGLNALCRRACVV